MTRPIFAALALVLVLSACGGSDPATAPGTITYTVDIQRDACHNVGMCMRMPSWSGPTPNVACLASVPPQWFTVDPVTLVRGYPCTPDGRCVVTNDAAYPVVQVNCQDGVAP